MIYNNNGNNDNNDKITTIITIIISIIITIIKTIMTTIMTMTILTTLESGFGDVDGDGGDGNISDFAALCLDELSKDFDSEEMLSVCMTAAWSLIAQVMIE